MTVQNEKFLPGILHRILTEVINERSDSRRLPLACDRRYTDRMLPLIGEEHLQTSAFIGCHISFISPLKR